MTPEQRRSYDREYRKRNLEKVRARQREWWRAKHGSETIKRTEDERQARKRDYDRKRYEAIKLAKGYRECQPKKSGPGTTPSRDSNSPASFKRKPGRLMAMAGWLHW